MKYAISFFLFWIFGTIHSQKKIDSIVKYSIKEFDSLARISPKKTLEDFTTFYRENKKEIDETPTALEQVYYAHAKYFYYNYDYENAKRIIKKGTQLIDDEQLDVPKFYYNNLIAGILANEEKIDSAAIYYTNSIEELEERGEYNYAAQLNYNIGSLYNENLNLQDAMSYFDKTLKYYDTIPDSLKGPTYSFMMGSIAYYTEKADSIESAKKIAAEAIKYGAKFNEKNGLIFGHLTLSDYYLDNNQQDSAVYYSQKAYDLAKENGFSDFYPNTSIHLAKIKADNDPKYALGILEAVPNIDGDRSLRFLGNLDQLLANLYAATENHKKANFHLNRYMQYTDSLHKTETNIKTAEILEKYQTARKEIKIAEQQVEISQKESQKEILSITAFSLGIFSILTLLFFHQRQKTQKQQIISLENEKENVALRSLMAGEEKERSRIAKELHDGLGGILAAAKMHASKGEDLTKVEELLDTASKESRRISHNLLPESLLIKGLDQALRDFIVSINESGLINVEYNSVELQNNLPKSLQLSIYRIIQELINNIIKHAGATEAFVQVQQQENKKLFITVEDNGKGFAHEETSKGIGLENITSRLSLLKGTLDIDSQEKKGTSVYIALELNK